MNTLWKTILAGVAIIIIIPAIYLPFCLQNIYHRTTALITHKLKDYRIIAHMIKEKEKK
jgi:low affinity Fe/Cu permease